MTCKLEASGAVGRNRKNKWNKRHKETVGGTVTSLLSAAKQRASKRAQRFDLTREWVAERVQNGTCEATGLPFVLDLADGAARNPWRPSIDKIVPAGGYTQRNCRMVVALYNFAKNEFGDADVLVMAKALIQRKL